MDERPLTGGRQTAGLVRVGGTLRRPPHARSAYVRDVLLALEAAGFAGAPRWLGVDEQGRDILSYVAGEVPQRSPFALSDARLGSAGRLVRAFHDATEGTALAAGGEVVCHGDLGPHNTVFAGEEAVAIIDWDSDLAPGPRLVDLAHAVWCYADVCEETVPVADQARRLRLVCAAYGWDDRAAVVGEIAARFERARDEHAAAGRSAAVAIFEEMLARMARSGAALARRTGP